MGILRLPEELLVAILAYLGALDILGFCRTNRKARKLYKDSIHLRYLVELDSTGLEETTCSPKPDLATRLAYVRGREKLWTLVGLDEQHRICIPVEYPHSHLHALSASVYVLGDLGSQPDTLRTNGLHYVRLPKCRHWENRREEQPQWTMKSLGVEALNIGLSLEQQDLLAVLTSEQVSDGDPLAFRLHLKSFFTEAFHPCAHDPVITVHEHFGEGNHCVASVQVSGPYLLILLTWLRAPSATDELYVYNWKQGQQIYHNSTPGLTYRAAIFLSSNTFVLTNIRQNTLDFMEIDGIFEEMPQPRVRQVGRLGLPDLRPGSTTFSMTCWTDNIQTLHQEPPPMPSLSSYTTSSLSQTFGTTSSLLAGPEPFKQPQSFLRCRSDKTLVQFRIYVQCAEPPVPEHVSHFSFVAHRGDLLRIVRNGALQLVDPGGNPVLPWNAWGPNHTRWGETDETDVAWMASVSGQRQAIVSGVGPRKIRIRDYNECTVRKHLRSLVGSPQSQVVTTTTSTAHQACFVEDIESSLPYVESTSAQEYEYDAVQIDGDHIIGVKENENGQLQELDVFVMVPDVPKSCDCNDSAVTST